MATTDKTPRQLGKWFSDTAAAWSRLDAKGTSLRMGQFFMNELWKFDQDLWNGVHMTDGDCFQVDARLPDFYAKLYALCEAAEIFRMIQDRVAAESKKRSG